jgi:hypothetical protein
MRSRTCMKARMKWAAETSGSAPHPGIPSRCARRQLVAHGRIYSHCGLRPRLAVLLAAKVAFREVRQFPLSTCCCWPARRHFGRPAVAGPVNHAICEVSASAPMQRLIQKGASFRSNLSEDPRSSGRNGPNLRAEETNVYLCKICIASRCSRCDEDCILHRVRRGFLGVGASGAGSYRLPQPPPPRWAQRTSAGDPLTRRLGPTRARRRRLETAAAR